MLRSSEHEAVAALSRLFRSQVELLIEPLRMEIKDLRAEIAKLKTEEKGFGGYVSINQICAQFSMSRSTFYRLLGDPDCALEEKRVVVRVPPVVGNWRVNVKAFEEWLLRRRRGTRRRVGV